MQKSIDPVQPKLDVMRQNRCQIQRPKKHRNDHTHHLCISKLFFWNAVLSIIVFNYTGKRQQLAYSAAQYHKKAYI